MGNGTYVREETENPPSVPERDRDMVIVLSDKISVALLAITWVILLVLFLRERRRNQRLSRS